MASKRRRINKTDMEISQTTNSPHFSGIVNIQEAANRLGVSTATIRNWTKSGLLRALAAKPLSFDADEVTEIAAKLRSGGIQRLRSRANKLGADKVNPETEWKTYP